MRGFKVLGVFLIEASAYQWGDEKASEFAQAILLYKSW